MVIDRRTLLRAFGGALVMLARPELALAGDRELFASARREGDGSYTAVIFDAEGRDLARVPLPARGHDTAVRPGSHECVTFARRPGNFAVAFEAENRRPPVWFTTRADRHFYGHGVFSPDGRLLYTTENDFEAGAGVIGVRDVEAGYRQIGEFPSFGTGPHDIALLADGRTLVVANGGIRTHPGYRGQKLNLADMKPSLAYIDTRTGDLNDQAALPPVLHRLSIRHLAVAGADQVVFGAQHNGPRTEQPALLGRHRRGSEISLFELGEAVYAQMRNYVSSVEADASGDHVAATSSHGGVAVVIEMASRSCTALHHIADVSGVAHRAGAPGFMTTNGSGAILAMGKPESPGAAARPVVRPEGQVSRQWDNHLVSVGVL